MRDARLAAPAVSAWAAAWAVVAAPDAGIPAWMPLPALWGLAAMLLVVALLGRGSGREAGRGLDPRTVRPRLVGAAATASIAAVAAALVATSAGIALSARDASPLATAAVARSTVDVVVELTAAPRAMASVMPAWAAPTASADQRGDGGPMMQARSSMRIEGRLLSVDGAPVSPVPVSGVVDAVPSTLQLGARLAFTARASPEPSAEASAFRLRAQSEVEVAAPPVWLAWSAGLRTGFADAATRLEGDGGALVPGLAIGDTSAVGEPLDAAMKASSLARLYLPHAAIEDTAPGSFPRPGSAHGSSLGLVRCATTSDG
ncbi:hypothetical protein [Agromyces sp. NPDC058064]|uniref:hypothetical protein n=1 Tax=Agromyces sp. NPDC058064 TaxID=3346322 RepID=UPI0036DA0464